MARFILLSFAFMGWGFYEMSGGADFKPGSYIDIEPDPVVATVLDKGPETVARADTSSATLTGITPASAQVIRAKPASPRMDVTLAAVDRAMTPESASPSVEAEKAAVVAALAISAVESETGTATQPDPATDEAGEIAAVLYSMKDLDASSGARSQDIREVAGSRVNMRNGPGTGYPVVSKLGRGDQVIVLQNTGDGWLKLRVVETNRIGWMADFLVTAAAE